MLVNKNGGLKNMVENSPFISFIIPTYNEEKNIATCLKSIFLQDYPVDKMEVIIVDGFSSDRTIDISKQYPVKILLNNKKIASEARNLGIRHAKGSILVFLDADCQLFQSNWLRLMIEPLLYDPKVAGSISILTPNKKYPAISRFFSLMQADPLVVFAYGSALDVKGDYVTKINYFPMGIRAIRRGLLTALSFKSDLTRLEDVDVTYHLVCKGFKFMIVKQAGFYHLLVDNLASFMKKTYDKIRYFSIGSSTCEFKFRLNKKLIYIILLNLVGIDSTIRIIKGIRRYNDVAWLYYPYILFSTLMFYSIILTTNSTGRNLLKNLLIKGH